VNEHSLANGGPGGKSVDEVAYGFLRVANEAMCRPIRNLTTMRGFDITTHALACFGGAGPQHCCAIAKVGGYTIKTLDMVQSEMNTLGWYSE
jgi:5-oxoprolinase (ATP-hydrolysing)